MIDKETLDTLTHNELLRVVAKSVVDLLEHEVLFLRARSAYLSDKELEKFESVLNAGEKQEEVVKEKKEKNLDKMNRDELTKVVNELGFEVPEGVTNKELVKFIESKQPDPNAQ